MAALSEIWCFTVAFTLVFCRCCPYGSCANGTPTSPPLATDTEALLSLKAALTDVSGRLVTWATSGNSTQLPVDGNASVVTHCKWEGVTCDGSFSVIGLDISSMGLSGSLSPSVGLLSNLVNLSVASNHFTGSLTSEIAALSGLRYLNISNNNFSNVFPSNFSRLNSLQILDAFNNNFTGELPLELSLLTSLKHLHLGGNFFSGRIHPQYGNMQGLEYLALSGNWLTGRIPAELGSLTELRQLYIGYYNLFEGGIPVELGRLTKLIRLDISSSGLNGTIPPVLGSLSNLDSLFLQENDFTGSIPPELGNLSYLKSLDLSTNRLGGTIPNELGSLHMLELLNLFGNSLHGSIPPLIGSLPNLQVLKLFGNNFTGIIPQHLGMDGHLIQVDLSSNSFDGPIPPHLCHGHTLEQLILMNNHFSGTIPDTFRHCPKLERIRLGYNDLQGPIPSSLLLLPALALLELPFNQLTGPLPDQIQTTSNLGSLDLSHNQLTGQVPPTIGNMAQLIYVDLSGNRISGSIPKEVGHLRKLATLDLSNNLLTGPIPSALSSCSSLTLLDLSHNQLQGEISPELSKLEVLDNLNVSRNSLSGPIPSSFVKMSTLAVADFSFNNFTGSIPWGGQFSSFNAISFIGNPGLCGTQIPVHCTQNNASDSPSLAARVKQQQNIILICVFAGGLPCLVGAIAWGFYRIEKLERTWELTAFEKLAFTAKNVVDCLIDDNIISKGGSAIVYKGLMPNNQMIAIKRFPASCKGSVEGDNGFSAEIQTLGCIRHRNIVRMLGFCTNHETNLLLLEYMPNGSLGDLLHGPRGGSLHWDLRYRIALDAAKGLCYLHHDHSPMIVHRDVKSNNILLDRNYEAHVADFGLAKALQDWGTAESMSSIAGSYGYIAPEYAYTLRVDEKSDVYSYGVVLLELVTGRRPTEPEYGDYIDIARWAKRKAQTSEGRMEIVDVRISVADGSMKLKQEIMLLLEVALRCVAYQPEQRPTLRDVVQILINGPRVKEDGNHNGPKGEMATKPLDLVSV